MSAPIDWSPLKGFSAESTLVTFEASAVTGFEEAARSEVMEMFGLKEEEVVKAQGRVLFDLQVENVKKVLSLRTVDNVWVVIGAWPNFDLKGKKDECMTRLIKSIEDLEWKKGLDVWKRVFDYEGDFSEAKKAKTEEVVPTFRCTCYRSGQNHSFTSMEAAREVGGAIQDKFQWKVQMKNQDIEVVLHTDKGKKMPFSVIAY